MFPVTWTTLEPVSSINKLDPRSKSWMGAVFAIPTLPRVTREVVAFVNCMVLVVTFPFSVICSRLEAMFSKKAPSPTNRVAYTFPTTPTPPETRKAPDVVEDASTVLWMRTSPLTSSDASGVASLIPTLEVLTSTKRFEAAPTVRSSANVDAPTTATVPETVRLFCVIRLPKISTVIKFESLKI